MNYKEEFCDVTTKLPNYVTAQCISEDCAMGAGVVLAFRKVFPGLKAACINHIEMANLDISRGLLNRNNVYSPYRHKDSNGVVYNMYTKKRYWHKAGKGISYQQYLQNLEESLFLVKAMMISNNENKLAMPKIGCGLDHCTWSDVKEIIFKVFSDTDFEIVICEYN